MKRTLGTVTAAVAVLLAVAACSPRPVPTPAPTASSSGGAGSSSPAAPESAPPGGQSLDPRLGSDPIGTDGVGGRGFDVVALDPDGDGLVRHRITD